MYPPAFGSGFYIKLSTWTHDLLTLSEPISSGAGRVGVIARNFQVHSLPPTTLSSTQSPSASSISGVGHNTKAGDCGGARSQHTPSGPLAPVPREPSGRRSCARTSIGTASPLGLQARRNPRELGRVRGARGGNQGRRARGLPSARMSAGAGSRSVWRVAAPAGCAARGRSPAVASLVACRWRARCASLPPGRPAR